MKIRKTEQRERDYFEQFFDIFSLPEGERKYTDKPDLIIVDKQSKKNILGIEQTALYIKEGNSNFSEQRQSILRKKVLKKAENRYKEETKGDLRLSVCFNKEYPITSIDESADNIFQIAKRLSPNEKELINHRKYKEVPQIFTLYAQWGLEAPWQLTQVHSVPTTSEKRIQELVDIKNNKASAYEDCLELWLLIIIDFSDPAQDQDIDNNIKPLYSDKFSKVILFKTVFNTTLVIPCIQ